MRYPVRVVILLLMGITAVAQKSANQKTIPDYSFKELWSFGWSEKQIPNSLNPLTIEQRGQVVTQLRAKSGSTDPAVVDSWKEGFFTKSRGSQQVILLVHQSAQSQPHSYLVIYDLDSKRVGIFDAQRILVPGSKLLTTVTDPVTNLEALLVFTPSDSGSITERAKLVEFKGAGFAVIKDFGAVVLDACHTGKNSGAMILRSVITYFPANTMVFRRRHYVSTCRDQASGRLLGSDDVDEEQFYQTAVQSGQGGF